MPTRRTSLLIVLSLAANAALAIVFWQRSGHAPSHFPHSDISPASSPPPAAPQTPAEFSAQWKQLLKKPDDTAALAFLRVSGFPPEIVRSLMTERIRARYQSRFSELAARQTEIPYWRGTSRYNFDGDVSTRAQRRALEREIADTIRNLVGSDADKPAWMPGSDNRQRLYGNLPSAKVTEIEAINRDYGEISSQIRETTKGVILPEDREKLLFLEKEKRADLAAVLSPEELEEYDRRNSPSAGEIRSKLRFFDATEAEFIALYQAQRDFDNRYGRDHLSGEQSDRRKAALPELAEQLKAALGPERFSEFELLTDGNYPATRNTLTQLGLPADSARELIATQRATNKQAAAVRADKSLSTEQQATQLAALEKDASEKITAAIGAENFAEYKKSHTALWLMRLAPASQMPSAR